eukprot:12441879-Alexandrium_andersonii.AAC.1
MASLAKLLQAGTFGESDPAVVAARAFAPDRAKQEPSGDEEPHAVVERAGTKVRLATTSFHKAKLEVAGPTTGRGQAEGARGGARASSGAQEPLRRG